ncbi:GW dipeptide domain-containing protein [Lonepinella sp. MS14437]|uniref:GW dipeptide domain-containing protein n=1 Tax=Lonepinella sp. MS14437 TaxID=3003620 RepID=UPI0036D8BDC2
MRFVKITNKLFASIIFLIFSILIYANENTYSWILNDPNYDKYFLKSNTQEYLVAVNTKGSELFIYRANDANYLLTYKGNNYTDDGLYIIDNISIVNNNIVIDTHSSSASYFKRHYISYINNKWQYVKTEHRFTEIVNSIRSKICIEIKNSEHCFYEIIKKSNLYKKMNTNAVTKMYLIKGDKVTILDEQTDSENQKWYFINYKGKKDINMWIKAEAVDFNEKE